MYKLIFAPEFVRDLDSTFEYISCTLTVPGAAKKLMREIDDAIMNLREMPYMYPVCEEPLDVMEYRKLVLKNYIIIYSVDEKKKNVNLPRSFYGRRDYLNFFS
ncbi:MAG: type II toxin-antitoxin system RelE/ParE family toxin [Oscillospiraceae bacterium]